MKKKVIAISTILVIVLFALMALVFMPRNVYEVEFEKDITVQGGVAQTEPLEYVIVIPEADEYVMRADWSINPSGLLAGIEIVDENGKDVNTFTAECITMDSAPMELEKGKYTMTLTFITSDEQWEAYFADYDTTSWDVAPGKESEYEFATDGEFTFVFHFTLEKYCSTLSIAIVLGTIIGVLLVIVFLAVCQTGDSMKQNYDERQELMRGRGFKYAFYTMIILNYAFYILDVAEISFPLDMGIAVFLSTLVGVGVYAVCCIWNDAYFALNEKAGTITLILTVGGIMNLALGINAWVQGEMIQDGELTFRSMNLFCGILMLVVCGTMMLKKLYKDREEE